MKETYKKDLQKRPAKETYKRDLQKRPTKETYKRGLHKRPTDNQDVKHSTDPNIEVNIYRTQQLNISMCTCSYVHICVDMS